MRYRLLLVDDSPEFLLTTEAILADVFDVTTAGSGDLALARRDLETFHIVCSDQTMPGTLGIDTL